MKHLEIKTKEYNGINITTKIDFDSGRASMMETHNLDFVKNWVFANRGLEFMNGWLGILKSMELCVLDMKKELEHDLAIKSAFKKKDQAGINKIIRDSAKVDKRKK